MDIKIRWDLYDQASSTSIYRASTKLHLPHGYSFTCQHPTRSSPELACSQSNGYRFLVATQSVHIRFHIIQLQIWTEHRVTLLTIRNLFVESHSRSLFKSEKQNLHILNLITHLQRFIFHHLHFHDKASTNRFSFRFEPKRIHRRIYITNSATWSKTENSPNVLEMPPAHSARLSSYVLARTKCLQQWKRRHTLSQQIHHPLLRLHHKNAELEFLSLL